MVGAIKRWLGIDKLELENAARADEIMTLKGQINALANAQPKEELTSAPPKAKIVPTMKRVNWRSFRSAVESASKPELEEA